MEYSIEEGRARSQRLVSLCGSINGFATQIQHRLGGIIELVQPLKGNKQTMGPRISSFRKSKLGQILDAESHYQIAGLLDSIVEYRNRIEHDEWWTQIPRVGDANEPVVGHGEWHFTTTNLPSIALLSSVFGFVARQCEDLGYDLYLASKENRGAPFDGKKYVESMSHAIGKLDTNESPFWKWRVNTLTRINFDDED